VTQDDRGYCQICVEAVFLWNNPFWLFFGAVWLSLSSSGEANGLARHQRFQAVADGVWDHFNLGFVVFAFFVFSKGLTESSGNEGW
jgi:hypothetical protein